MAVNLNDVGIQSSSLTLLESVDYSAKLEEVVILDLDSSFGDAEAFDPIVEYSMKGKGALPAALVIGTDGGLDGPLTGINDGLGTAIITSVKTSETNDDFNGWEISGTYYAGAV